VRDEAEDVLEYSISCLDFPQKPSGVFMQK